MNESLSQRFKILIKVLDISAAALGKKAGIERQIITRVTTGRTSPSFETLAALLKAYPDLNARWMILGEEKMWMEKDENTKAMNKESKKYTADCQRCNDLEKSNDNLTKFNDVLLANYEAMERDCINLTMKKVKEYLEKEKKQTPKKAS